MAIVILQNGEILTKDNLQKSREDHDTYIKFTIDLVKNISALGGEYHADSEQILINKYQCLSKNIVGGGYNISQDMILTNAMLNIRPNLGNASPEILDLEKRVQFLKISQELVSQIKKLL